MLHTVFLSGGTGYLGQPVSERLAAQGHEVRVLCRPGSRKKIPPAVQAVIGDALDASSFSAAVSGCDTYIHLTGAPHPAPWKGPEFRAIDLVSLKASAQAAQENSVGHFIYVSVAHPAPVMRDYIEVRQECERILAETKIPATVLRPWYVVGPGHWWPLILKPTYALAERIPSLRESALRLGLVTHRQMIQTLVWALNNPGSMRVLTVPDIRRIGSTTDRRA